MIVVGLSASMVIVLSQNLPQLPDSFKEQQITEQTAASSTEQSYITTPADIVPSGNAVQLNESSRSLLEIILPERTEERAVFYYHNVFVGYFHVLLRAVISPNAP